MSKEPKYRPYLTLPEIKSLIQLIEECQEVSLNSVLTTLKLLTIKAESGMIGSSYVPTGNKPGPTSKVDIIKADISSVYDKQRKDMPYSQAVTAAKIYTDLGQSVPQDIQTIIDLGDTSNDSHN